MFILFEEYEKIEIYLFLFLQFFVFLQSWRSFLACYDLWIDFTAFLYFFALRTWSLALCVLVIVLKNG